MLKQFVPYSLNWDQLNLKGFNCKMWLSLIQRECPFHILCRPFKEKIALSIGPSIPSVCHENLTLALTLPFLHISSLNIKIYRLCQDGHDDATLLRSRSQLLEFCSFFILVFLTRYLRTTQVFNWTHPSSLWICMLIFDF